MPAYVDDAGKVYLNTPEALKAAKWMVDFSKVAPKETSHEICKANIVDKKVGAWWTGPWAIADLEKAGIKYGILPLGKPFVGIKAAMLTSNAVDRGNAEAAVEFMKWYTSAGGAEEDRPGQQDHPGQHQGSEGSRSAGSGHHSRSSALP